MRLDSHTTLTHTEVYTHTERERERLSLHTHREGLLFLDNCSQLHTMATAERVLKVCMYVLALRWSSCAVKMRVLSLPERVPEDEGEERERERKRKSARSRKGEKMYVCCFSVQGEVNRWKVQEERLKRYH